jgi:hypothetical protein
MMEHAPIIDKAGHVLKVGDHIRITGLHGYVKDYLVEWGREVGYYVIQGDGHTMMGLKGIDAHLIETVWTGEENHGQRNHSL